MLSPSPLLLQRYGSAYLVTSISLSIVSFGLSYILVSAGVDVASLLEKARSSVVASHPSRPMRADACATRFRWASR